VTDQEKKDLEELKVAIAKLQTDSYQVLRHYSRLTPDDLKYTGHKTVEGAVFSVVVDTLKKADKLTAAFLKKYPDK
jgi:hypothetical protein